MSLFTYEDRPSQDTSDSIDYSSWVNPFMLQAESVPVSEGPDHLLPPTPSSTHSPRVTLFAQQHTLPSPLESNLGYPFGIEARYQYFEHAPGNHGLGLTLSPEFGTYGMMADADGNQFLSSAPMKAEPSYPANEGTYLPNLEHHMRSTPPMDVGRRLGTDADVERRRLVERDSYAEWLFECLKEAKDHTRPLKEIYEWVEKNTSKVRDPTTKGWMNSVRHNLSMNAAFEKVAPNSRHGSKKGGAGLWRLTNDALTEGEAEPTTRFRKPMKRKHEGSTGEPDPKRQDAGSKGGQATRDAGRRNRQMEQRAQRAHATSAPTQRRPRRLYHHSNRFATPSNIAATASLPAMNPPLPMLNTPLAPQFQYDGFSSDPPNAMQFQYLTSMPLSTPMHTMTRSPVLPTLGNWDFADMDPINRRTIADQNAQRWYPDSTPGLTSDSSPFLNSIRSFQSPLHISRESSAGI